MMLIPDNIKIPTLDDELPDDPICQVKLIHPMSSYVYYVIAFDGEDLLYGWVPSPFAELGYASLSEMSRTEVLGFTIERDRNFKPTPLSEVQALHQ